MRARLDGVELDLTPEEIQALAPDDRAALETLVDGVWVRPFRFCSDGSDLDLDQ